MGKTGILKLHIWINNEGNIFFINTADVSSQNSKNGPRFVMIISDCTQM
jgi:hypothetical protein